MIPKPFDQIDKTDIDRLITEGVPEGKTIEYKETLIGETPNEKKEFLADVSSFANGSGGDLLFGISGERDSQNKSTGRPQAAVGLVSFNSDTEILRLENILRTGLDPRLPAIQMKPIGGGTNGPLLLLRIPKSWNGPHMIKESSRFYSRNSGGKYPLDASELRSAFTLANDLPRRIRSFRDERLARIVANETPITLTEGPKLILHLIPLAALDPAVNLDLPAFLRIQSNDNFLEPLGAGSWRSRYNFDGHLTFGKPATYLQIFRTGALEYAETIFPQDIQGKLHLPGQAIAMNLIIGVTRGLEIVRRLEQPLPTFVLITLLGVKNCFLAVERHHLDTVPIDRDLLLLPDVMVDNYSDNPIKILRPIFDALWQTVGQSKCSLYDSNGEWIK